MRMEVGYKVSGDMTNECSPFEAGLMRFVTPAKLGFIGRDALLVNREAPRWMLVQLEVDPGEFDADCLGRVG